MSNFENQVFSLLENTWKRHLSVSSWTTNLQGSRSASYQQMSLSMRSKYTLINSYVTLNRTLSQGAFAAAIKIILKNAATFWVNTIWLPFRKLVTFKRPYLIFYFDTTFMNVLRVKCEIKSVWIIIIKLLDVAFHHQRHQGLLFCSVHHQFLQAWFDGALTYLLSHSHHFIWHAIDA